MCIIKGKKKVSKVKNNLVHDNDDKEDGWRLAILEMQGAGEGIHELHDSRSRCVRQVTIITATLYASWDSQLCDLTPAASKMTQSFTPATGVKDASWDYAKRYLLHPRVKLLS